MQKRCYVRLDHWRNLVAVRVFDLLASPVLREQTARDLYDARRWRAHDQRRRLGFVKCEEIVPLPTAKES